MVGMGQYKSQKSNTTSRNRRQAPDRFDSTLSIGPVRYHFPIQHKKSNKAILWAPIHVPGSILYQQAIRPLLQIIQNPDLGSIFSYLQPQV